MVNDVILVTGAFLASMMLFLSVWSCCVSGIKSKLCFIPFTFFTMMCLGIFGGLGVFMIAAHFNGEAYINQRCDIVNYTNELSHLSWIEQPIWSFIHQYDTSVVSATDELMCTSTCPCFLNNKSFYYYKALREYKHN